MNNNDKFSPCSIHNMTLVLEAKGTCFSTSPSGFCGDFIVEKGEQCDAGISGDVCCFGASAATPCKFNGSATCSSADSVCCTK